MRALILLIVVGTIAAPAALAGPPAEETPVVRPVIWWSDLARISDGGGPAFKPSTEVITDAKAFAKVWAKLELQA